jgi:hypothetical protein
MSYGSPFTWLQIQYLHKLLPEKKEGENEPCFAWQTLGRICSHRKLKTEIKYNTLYNKPAYDA